MCAPYPWQIRRVNALVAVLCIAVATPMPEKLWHAPSRFLELLQVAKAYEIRSDAHLAVCQKWPGRCTQAGPPDLQSLG